MTKDNHPSRRGVVAGAMGAAALGAGGLPLALGDAAFAKAGAGGRPETIVLVQLHNAPASMIQSNRMQDALARLYHDAEARWFKTGKLISFHYGSRVIGPAFANGDRYRRANAFMFRDLAALREWGKDPVRLNFEAALADARRGLSAEEAHRSTGGFHFHMVDDPDPAIEAKLAAVYSGMSHARGPEAEHALVGQMLGSDYPNTGGYAQESANARPPLPRVSNWVKNNSQPHLTVVHVESILPPSAGIGVPDPVYMDAYKPFEAHWLRTGKMRAWWHFAHGSRYIGPPIPGQTDRPRHAGFYQLHDSAAFLDFIPADDHEKVEHAIGVLRARDAKAGRFHPPNAGCAFMFTSDESPDLELKLATAFRKIEEQPGRYPGAPPGRVRRMMLGDEWADKG